MIDLQLAFVTGLALLGPLALYALGMNLIWRASGFLNLSLVQVGVTAAVLFDCLARGAFLLRPAQFLCGNCMGQTPGPTARTVVFVVAAVISIAVAVLLSWVSYVLVFRRFAKVPILMSMVVSVFLAQALAGTHSLLTKSLIPAADLQSKWAIPGLIPPWSGTVTIFGSIVTTWQMALLVLAVGCIAVTAWRLRVGKWGICLRACSQAPSRAAALGLNSSRVAGRAWILAGLFAGLAGVVGSFVKGNRVLALDLADKTASMSSALSLGPLLIVLAALVIGGFTSWWRTLAALAVLSILQQWAQYATGSTARFEAAYVVIVGAVLLVRRTKLTRAVRDDLSGLTASTPLRPIPMELARHDRVRSMTNVAITIGAVVAVGLPIAVTSGTLSLVIDALSFTLVALSLLLLTGWGGQVSLGQFGFVAIGMWATASSGLSLLPAILLSAITGAVVGVLIGYPALRLRGVSLAITTLAFAVSMPVLLFDPSMLGRFVKSSVDPGAPLGLDMRTQPALYALGLILVVGTCLALVGLRRSRFARALIALRANEGAAQAFGLNPVRIRLTAFALSGALAAVAGALLTGHAGQATPSMVGPAAGLIVFLFVLVGGLGTLWGPLLGSAFYAMVTLFFPGNPLIAYVGTGIGAILLLYAVPGGLAQAVGMVRDRILLRLAYHDHIPVPSLMGDGGIAAMLGKAPLDEKRMPVMRGQQGALLRYRPGQQWALDRLGGSSDQINERVGERND